MTAWSKTNKEDKNMHLDLCTVLNVSNYIFSFFAALSIYSQLTFSVLFNACHVKHLIIWISSHTSHYMHIMHLIHFMSFMHLILYIALYKSLAIHFV